jgi:hypothetical protein
METVKKKIIWKIFALYDRYCKYRLNKLLPGIQQIINDYTSKTKSTGTKYPTLYNVVKIILKKKPRYILELGTGTSTVVLAETILQIQKKDPSYNCKIVSMESVQEWYDMASQLLPKNYSKIVEIVMGKRELYEYSMFRGYVHSNIPNYSFDFIFLDGPNYSDEKGSSTCMDIIKIRLQSDDELISCVVDTRVSSVWMMQQIFSVKIIKYFPIFRTCSFDIPKIYSNPQIDSSSFNSSFTGRLNLKSKNLVKK